MKLALGSVQFGMNYGVGNAYGRVPFQEANAIFQEARKCGIDTIDTAIAYGDSELLLGRMPTDNWKIITKLPAVPHDCDNVEQWVSNEIRQSMERLQIKQLYGVLLHQPSQLLNPVGQGLHAALLKLKAMGMTRKIGVSIYSPVELIALFDNFTFDIVQAPLNILDRSLVDSGWASKLHDMGVEVHTRSTFLQGLLLMSANQRPAKFDRWADIWNVWDQWLAREGLSPVQACIRYAINLSMIDRVVVGVDTVNQLKQILEATNGTVVNLPEFKKLDDDRLINPATWSQL